MPLGARPVRRPLPREAFVAIGDPMVVDGWLDALFPASCAGCRRPGSPLCAACRPPPEAVCHARAGALNVHAAGRYAGALRRAILAFKRGRRDCGAALAALFAERLAARVPRGVVLVPVPTARVRRRERAFDQSVVLANSLGHAADVPVLAVLRQVAGDAQRGRSRAARLVARGRFACTAPSLVAGARIVLVDDVMTTGATLRDCAATLECSGAIVREACVLALA
jgi:ComF family protein